MSSSSGARGMGSWRDIGVSRVGLWSVGSVSVRMAPLVCSFGCWFALGRRWFSGDAWTWVWGPRIGLPSFFSFSIFSTFLLPSLPSFFFFFLSLFFLFVI